MSDPRFASTQARQLAARLDLDADAIPGSGRGGSITLADVRKAAPPEEFGAAGAALWRQVRTGWVLRPDEEALLRAACQTADELGRIEEALERSGIIIPGSKGQDRANPLLGEARAHRLALRSLLAGIGITDAEAGAGDPDAQRSHAGRALARQRWARRHGAAA